MGATEATISVIDDDVDVREAVGRLLRSAGWKTHLFASAREYLESRDSSGLGCIILDVCMPDMTGPELHASLRERAISVPIVYLSGRCDVPISVLAMKRGAQDVLQKPVDDETLLSAIASAVEWHRGQRRQQDAQNEIASRLAALSARERQVMDHVILGRLNKQIAADLGITEKTVKVHRGRVMAKMRVRSVAELVRLCDGSAIEA